MEYKYQIVILGSPEKLANEIIDLLFQRIRELKLQEKFYRVIYASQFDRDFEANQPTYALYFGSPTRKYEDIAIVERLISLGKIVLPIFYDSFKNEIPKILENQNGLKWDHYQKEKVVSLILESFGKLRNTRKVFISYKRDESSSVAIQLYEALEKNNFDVFLDTHSIKQGEPFQEELWHRMTDCDVIVLLNTPNFLKSEWCEKEIAEASVKRIGVLQLIWPDETLSPMAEVCFPYQLETDSFKSNIYGDKDLSRLTDDVVNNIIQKVESIRARNLAAREESLITEFLNLARKNGRRVNIQPERFITEELSETKRRIFIPSVGIPQSIDYNQSSELKREIKQYSVDEVFLIYDNIRIREKWLRHLDYLNTYLDVKTIKKQEFESWFQTN